MREICFELCAESLAACLAAGEGGADRIELCASLEVGGLTPADGLVREAVAQSGVPVHGMVRPRGGDFVYSAAELGVMGEAVRRMKELGAAGVVFGLLRGDGTVDIERTGFLVDLARPMQVTFHRAFDETPDLLQGLEDVIASGCDRVLTSGGQPDVLSGAPMLARLVVQAGSRLVIAAGGGLRSGNAAEVGRVSGASHFHGSLLHELPPGKTSVEAEDIRAVVKLLRGS
jgi:copper homeostasis protein